MALTMQRSATATAVSRKSAVAPVGRPVTRAFTAQRPVVSSARAAETRRAAGVVARATPAADAAAAQKSAGTEEWFALVCNAEWFYMDPQNESVAEQLRERVRYFKEQGKEGDFYLVPNPAWLESKIGDKKVKKPAVALISTDKLWITFMKLRLDRVLKIDLSGMSTKEACASEGPLPDFKPSEKWTAPYARYTPGWWNVFEPKA
ncbi:hypothetical protein HYH03_009571 [Edaphochlamys debaryana]|uniref:Uncharacterized protein n=1 Tax=Edaphochlamys debaryana TaxID=47281 RepID=A0A835XY65_9CHLO|nr:hypothetical protein HYH03_009571 [Edaphochlamys debaryana]|eukprot:KAG2492075.1 hypothetical protein HYH03_009571 [Edaphochlamys debaryana]